MQKQAELSSHIQAYEQAHNIPHFKGFGQSAIKIDDPHYQALSQEQNNLLEQIDELKIEISTKERATQAAAPLEQAPKVSDTPNPYPSFATPPKSWRDIEKIKGQDYISDLKRWHHDSHPSTKNADGSPKVFYHGTKSDKFEVFEAGQSESGREGIYFSTSANIAKDYDVWDQGVYEVFLHYKSPLEVDFQGVAYNSKQGREILKTIPQKLSQEHDAVIYKNIRDDNQKGAGELADTIVVFDPSQIKHIENRGIEQAKTRKYFNHTSPNIYQSNPHLGAGLLGGSASGVEQDESGALTFSPEKFALGLLGGTAASKAVSKAHKRFLQSKPHRIIPFINKQTRPTAPRFETTKELEKTYRNAQIKPSQTIQNTLNLSGAIKGDFIKLAQKHPEYFAHPQEAKDLCEYVFNNAFVALQASDKKQALIIAKLQDSKNDYGSVAFRVQNRNGEHRIRSVILMEQSQVEAKIQKAQKLGEPILQFW